MHPVMIQAIAAERVRESQARAEASRLTRQFRRARRRSPARSARPAFAGLRRLPRPALRAQVRDNAA